MDPSQRNARSRPLQADVALGILVKCANDVKFVRHLSDAEKRRVDEAVEILIFVQTTSKRKKYRTFLYSLLAKKIPHLVFLSAVALGQSRVVDMKKGERIRLIGLMEGNHQLRDTIFRSLAIDYKVPQSIDELAILANANSEISSETRCVAGVEDSTEEQRNQRLPFNQELPAMLAKDQAEGIDHTRNANTGRQIQFMYSKSPADHIPYLRDLIIDAVQTSRQWKTEREAGELTTDCLTTMIPEDVNEDISITLWVGQSAGLALLDVLKLQPTWSSLLGHLAL
ncbi:uncharacterized protein TRUGW13939_04836 [Talaromyces rugulosus]|uniref:Uncharacterized protein n=1 Tax=Talaromyces rugulosus TaxID=121627 RepID=A0A7H8QUS5_TALRU|nr:uncharacterized protein TRUGW13939_04836 [Talaromyces rugulosus]QKX57717.1 hypothetical protein TRUGW13939_04836 [Talaromyces rugulosus]